MGVVRALLVVCVLCACGRIGFDEVESPEAADDYASSVRLKHEWYELDGTRIWRGTYDSVLEQECAIDTWLDGNTYCIPRGLDVGYLDAACTMPVIRIFDVPC